MADTKLNIVIEAKDAGTGAAFGRIERHLHSVERAARRAAGATGSVFRGAGSVMSRFGAEAGKMGAVAGRVLTSMPAQMAVASGGMLSLAGAAGVMKSVVSNAAEFEGYETSMRTLLGSTDAARERMAALSRFAESTPFELPEVVRASKTLETLTNGALSTGDGLRLVGDVAAMTGEPFDALSVHVGRLYDGLQTGRAVGESLMRLQELGVISGDVRGEIEKLQAAGKKGDEVWNVAAATFSRFGGEMERRSKTFSGIASNMADAWGSLTREMGKPVMDALKPLLQDIIAWFERMKPAAVELGNNIALALDTIRAALQGGNLGELIARSVGIGLEGALVTFMALLAEGMVRAGQMLGAAISAAWESAKSGIMGDGEVTFADALTKNLAEMGDPVGIDGLASEVKTAYAQELEALWAPFLESARKAKAARDAAGAGDGDGAAATPGASASASATDAKRNVAGDADALAKVGIFAGGMATQAMNYARRTADASDRMARSLGRIERAMTGSGGATWAT